MKILKKPELGFTFTEFTITAILIGVISILAIANYEEFKQRAYDTEAITSLTSMEVAAKTLISEFTKNIETTSASSLHKCFIGAAYSGAPNCTNSNNGMRVTFADYLGSEIIDNPNVFLQGSLTYSPSSDYAIAFGGALHCQGTKYYSRSVKGNIEERTDQTFVKLKSTHCKKI